MSTESFKPKNPELSKAELERRLSILEDQKKKAEVENPECAGGGCGGHCGTVLCVKKIKGAITKIKNETKTLNTEEE